MDRILCVGIGSLLGGLARYGLTGLVHRYLNGSFPYGTLAVNTLGCLVIGSVLYLVQDRSMLGPNARLFITVGLLGGFTTFSAFGYETMELLRGGEVRWAFLNVAGNVILGLGAVWLGRAISKLAGL